MKRRIRLLFSLCFFSMICSCSLPFFNKEEESNVAPAKVEIQKEVPVRRVYASYYGGEDDFNGKTTASGERYDPTQLTAAHKTLPFGTILKVTNPKNGKTVNVRINDRGPFVKNRSLDLSFAAAKKLDLTDDGTGLVEIREIR